MKLSSRIQHLGIRQRVLILALLPMLMITFALSSYMITSRLNSEREALFVNAQTLLNYLANGAELGMFASNESALRLLARAPLQRPEISDIIFVDTTGNTVFRATDISIPATSKTDITATPHQLGELWLLQAPVLLSGESIDDFIEDQSAEELEPVPEVIGWVSLLINEDQLKQHQRGILFRGLLITLIGLSLTIWLALAIGRSITHPIQGIVDTIHRLRQEDLDARISAQSQGEIGELENGINNLADKVQRTHVRLQDQIDEATKNLWVTLERLETKNIALDGAKKRAEQANQAKDQFLARMSHELRTPLTSVIGFIQLLQKTTLNKEQKEYSTIVSRTSSLLLSLIDDILDFSKLQSDAINIEKIAFNLEECIEDTLSMQTALANDKGLSLYFISDPKMPDSVLGDPTRVRQVVSNLVSNAIKFTASGNITVRIDCQTKGATVNLRLSVKDTGIGISPEKMNQLFQPFSQADNSITRRFGGTGLGLVITKHLVELMGGNIDLESESGRGTLISIGLGFQIDPQIESRAILTDTQVLIFSRRKQAREELSSALAKWKVGIQTVSHQRQLLTQLNGNEKPADMVIIDLPRYSTKQFYLQQLLASIRRRYSGKLLLTIPKDGQFNDSASALLADFAPIQFLPKPLSRPKLLELLQTSNSSDSDQLLTGEDCPSSNSLCGLELLVAEDNDFNRLLLKKILESAGAIATMVINGEQALAQAGQKQFDCILMDIHMPLMDGIEASRLIRQLPVPLNTTPIIALTANVIANEDQQLKQTGVDNTLFKPINEALVISHIQKAANVQVTTAVEKDTGKPRLSDYGISNSALHIELGTQINAIRSAYRNKDIIAMRDHSHQLMGLAGLLDLVELEAATTAFNHAVKTTTWKEIWKNLWRLQRVIDAVNP